MPKPTDHEERRRFVVSVATSLILTDGLESVTQRKVAKAAGYSTAIVNHYFRNKQELLQLIYRTAADAYRARVRDVIESSNPALRETLIAMLPLCEDSRREWLVFCAFLGSGVAAPILSSEQAQRIGMAEQRIAGLLEDEWGERLSREMIDVHATRLVNFIDGVSISILVAPDRWPEGRAIMFVDHELEALDLLSRPRGQ